MGCYTTHWLCAESLGLIDSARRSVTNPYPRGYNLCFHISCPPLLLTAQKSLTPHKVASETNVDNHVDKFREFDSGHFHNFKCILGLE